MLNRTFLLSGMKGCYLSRAKRELRAMNIWLLLSALVYLRRCLSTSTREQGSSKTHIFYAVEIDGDSNTASFLAKQHGMQFISKPVRLVHDVYESNFQPSKALSQIHLKDARLLWMEIVLSTLAVGTAKTEICCAKDGCLQSEE
nr:uncharacterized protein LOC113458862 isoform X1 [Zonotrichia albicollis]